MLLVNKQELADRLRVSVPTLNNWIKRWDDFPVEQHGTNGRDYQFDAEQVFAFLTARKAEEAAAQTEKDQQLQQLIMPGLEPDPSEQLPSGLTIKDQRELLQIRRMQRQEAELNRELLPAAPTRDLLSDAFASWNARLHAAIRAAAREHNLDAALVAAIDTRVADAQREFVRETQAILQQAADAKPRDLFN